MSNTPVAAVDCGTNSTRLLVSDGQTTLAREMVITRLGEGVDATGRLSEEAMKRTCATLARFRQMAVDLGVRDARIVATSAVRDASNRDDFVAQAHAAFGWPLEVLSGDAEALLSFRGATADLNVEDGPFLVVDIGGGSTEIVMGSEEPEAWRSLDVGCVRLTERFFTADPPLPEDLSNALGIVRDHLKDLVRDLPLMAQPSRMIGLAGTVSAAAAVEQGLATYDRSRIHHFTLTRAAAEDVFRTLATEAADDRRHNPGLEAARVDVIVGGAAVLVSVMRHWAFDEMIVSEADILDGLVRSQL